MSGDGDGDSLAYRVHYQVGLNNTIRLRGILGFEDVSGLPSEFDYLRFEGMLQLTEDEEAGWDSALRLEVQLAEGDNTPSRVRLGWTHSRKLATTRHPDDRSPFW